MWEYGPGPRAAGAMWARRTGAGSGPEIGGAVVALGGLRSPLRLVDLGFVQTVLPELGPVARATRRSGCRLGELPSGEYFGLPVQSKLPGRKFQSPGVPPARLIELASSPSRLGTV